MKESEIYKNVQKFFVTLKMEDKLIDNVDLINCLSLGLDTNQLKFCNIISTKDAKQ